MQAIVLAAGKGTRMCSDIPKVAHEILGFSALEHVVRSLKGAGVKNFYFVVGSGAEQVRSLITDRKILPENRCRFVLQKEQKGTGHAVMMCEKALKGMPGDVLICPGDMPLLRAETLRAFSKAHLESGSAASVLSSNQRDPEGYGRILRQHGKFIAIREELDATENERKVTEVNSGVYLFKIEKLFNALKKIKPSNKKGEFYLTDVIEVLESSGDEIAAFSLASSNEGLGINTRKDLAEAMRLMGQSEIERHMASGVTFVLPEQTMVSPDVKIGKDTVIYPWTYIEPNVRIGRKCSIGPFAKIRSGTSIDDGSVIGSFVEVSRSKIGKNVFAKHLAYLGDAEIGSGSNIGAGAITANFDGKNKNKIKIGKANLIGSNTVLVAPLKLGDHVKTGAGAVVTSKKNIKNGEIMVGVPARPLKSKK